MLVQQSITNLCLFLHLFGITDVCVEWIEVKCKVVLKNEAECHDWDVPDRLCLTRRCICLWYLWELCVWPTYLRAGLNLRRKPERKCVCVRELHINIWNENNLNYPHGSGIHSHLDYPTILSYVLCSVCGRVTKERSKSAPEDPSFFGFVFLAGIDKNSVQLN